MQHLCVWANVVEHSQAKHAHIAVSRVEGQILLHLGDNGIGSAPDKVVIGKATDTGGFGLFSIRERLNQLGASLEIYSQPGQGCTGVLRAPVQRS
ncbi:MAG: hypothetical protein GY809_30870 [Planctomycetes bacterium]|nr:hypothetical protein [Planctomycetota bacterium]